MAHDCSLDLLSAEVLHTLFTYFLAHEILFSFSGISHTIDRVLRTYSAYRLDLKSIRRADFDSLCDRIRPENIISLTLSDDNDTPGQTELFLSRFRLEQFTHLRSLTLIQIEFESIEAIFSNLDKLKQLKVLSFNEHTIRYKYPKNYSNEHNRIIILLSNTYHLILPQLNRLYFSNSIKLTNLPISNLRHLKLDRCSISDLKIIFQNAPELKSLDVCLNIEESHLAMNFITSQLIRLKLEIKGYSVSMDRMEQFLSNLPCLKYLELIVHCLQDFSDGYKWEILTKYLKTFNFKFSFPFHLKSDDLHSFQTSYWLLEKNWLVIEEQNCLFSIPHFAPNHLDINKWSDKWSINSIHTINIKGLPRNQFAPYTHIKRLYINCLLSRDKILSIVELKHVECLSILSINDLLMFVPLESTISNLSELIIENMVTFHMIEQLKGYQMKQIRKLSISISDKNTDLILQELLYVFPHIESLRYLSGVCSMETMIRLIDGFVYLMNVSFYSLLLSPEIESDPYLDSNLIIENSHRLTETNFSYRVQHLLGDKPLVATHWWIEAEPFQSFSTVQWPSGYKYVLSKIQYLLFQSADTTFDRIMLHFSVCCIISQLLVPLYPTLLHAIGYTIGYNSISLYIPYILLTGILYSFILLLLAFVTFTSSSGARLCISFIICQYCILNQCCRFLVDSNFHSAIGTIFITIYDARYIFYMSFKWLITEFLHLI